MKFIHDDKTLNAGSGENAMPEAFLLSARELSVQHFYEFIKKDICHEKVTQL
ncbi:hypothetical protein [Paenibacillus nanensis]|uniref:hypothetical protein n=1 Tax=Paenibacillus nanensis TaxID=393251 RepID=UPI0013C3031E|nr:hypothetical protein [Paenibacillus nanensis]